MGESLTFCTNAKRTICELCDPTVVRHSIDSGASYLLLSVPRSKNCRPLFCQTVFDVQQRHADTAAGVSKSRTFTSVDALAMAIMQQKQTGDDGPTSFVLETKKPSWYRSLVRSSTEKIEAMQRKLRRLLPQIRFMAAPVLRPRALSETAFEQTVVLLGANRNASLLAAEKAGSAGTILNQFEKYSIVAALTRAQRARLLWSDTTTVDGVLPFVTECAICSSSIECI
jgi:hypothetical protein